MPHNRQLIIIYNAGSAEKYPDNLSSVQLMCGSVRKAQTIKQRDSKFESHLGKKSFLGGFPPISQKSKWIVYMVIVECYFVK